MYVNRNYYDIDDEEMAYAYTEVIRAPFSDGAIDALLINRMPVLYIQDDPNIVKTAYAKGAFDNLNNSALLEPVLNILSILSIESISDYVLDEYGEYWYDIIDRFAAENCAVILDDDEEDDDEEYYIDAYLNCLKYVEHIILKTIENEQPKVKDDVFEKVIFEKNNVCIGGLKFELQSLTHVFIAGRARIDDIKNSNLFTINNGINIAMSFMALCYSL